MPKQFLIWKYPIINDNLQFMELKIVLLKLTQ